jgi:hypothetical protein
MRDHFDSGIELITNPPQGSKLSAAKELGIDLTLLLENLALAPTERLQKHCAVQALYEELRRAGEQNRTR